MDPGRADRELGVPVGLEESEEGGGGKVGIMGPTGPVKPEAAVSAMAALKASPWAPKVLKDVRSVASAPFYTGNDPLHWQGGTTYLWTTTPNGTRKRVRNPVLPLPSDPTGRPPKGSVTFAPLKPNEDEDDGCALYVIGGGSHARWEIFELRPLEGGAGWVALNKGFRLYLTRQFVD